MARVTYLEDNGSNHKLLLLESNPSTYSTKQRFKFQERWSNLGEVRNIVASTWSKSIEGSPMYQHFQRLKQCRHKLVSWQCNNSVNSNARIIHRREQLAAMKKNRGHQNISEILSLEKELMKAY